MFTERFINLNNNTTGIIGFVIKIEKFSEYCNMTPESQNSSFLRNGSVKRFPRK
jgi:hypothetical protein